MINKTMASLFKLIPLINSMKNGQKKLLNKSSSLILCSSCSFFPTCLELPALIEDETIYEIKWRCSHCEKINTCTTDYIFKHYCISSAPQDLLLDSTANTFCQDTLLLIDAGLDMADPFISLSALNDPAKKEQMHSKKDMIKQSRMLASYLQMEVAQKRLKYGKHFTWDYFIQKKSVSKIQYALWLADKLRAEMVNLKVSYFQQDLGKGNDQIKLSKHILNHKFFQMISKPSEPCPQVQPLSEYFKSFSENTQVIIISTGSLKQVQQLFSTREYNPSIVIVNLEQTMDPITLAPTSTNHYLLRKNSLTKNAHLHQSRYTNKTSSVSKVNEKEKQKQIRETMMNKYTEIKIFDYRLTQQKSLKDWVKAIADMTKGTSKEIDVFVKRVKKNSKGNWQKAIDKELCKKVLQKNQKQKGSTGIKLFAAEKSKQIDLIQQFNQMTNKNHQISAEAIESFLKNACIILNQSSKCQQIRVCLKYESNLVDKVTKNTVLWTDVSSPGQEPILSQDFISLDYPEDLTTCRECEECQRYDAQKRQMHFEL